MGLTHVFRIALHSLARNKVRSLLTALGVLFGVAAVISMLSIGEGARQEATEQVKLLGANTVFIRNTWPDWQDGGSEGLTRRDAEALGNLEIVRKRAELRRYPDMVAQAGSRRIASEVVATVPVFAGVVNLTVSEGRFFDQWDRERSGKVCVLGSSLERELFAFENACGGQVKLNGTWFTVVGVADYRKVGKSRVAGLSLPSYNTQVFVPITAAEYFETGGNRGRRPAESIDEIVLQVARTGGVLPASVVAQRMLDRLHGGQEDFKVIVPEALLAQSRRTQRTFSIVMGAIAGISLLVGGIGIMNIMLATVLERRHEIGVRRASGATTRLVMLQFLAEAVLLSLVGCVVGIGLGMGIAAVVSAYAQWRTAVNPLHLAVAVGVAGTVGVVSGYYPAMKAASITPGEALRYE
jgi:putative ABC transport system permease protein